MDQAVESFSKVNRVLNSVQGKEETVVSGSKILIRLVEEPSIDADTGKLIVPYSQLILLLEAELKKDPDTVRRDLLQLLQPATCLPTLLSWFTRK